VMSKERIARIAGLIYLVVVITGMFSLAYVPKQLFVYDNAELTFRNILNNESLFRLSIASSVICYTAFIFLPVALYQLLKSVNELYSKLMIVLAFISIPISFYNLTNKYAILSLVRCSKQESAQAMGEFHQQTMINLSQYDNGIFIATVFWGLWLLPFGYLVFKSGFLPRILGVLLMLGCFGYLINFFGNTLSGSYSSLAVKKYIGLLPSIAELGTCFWLLVMGVKEKRINP
jgi:hypothetical protein